MVKKIKNFCFAILLAICIALSSHSVVLASELEKTFTVSFENHSKEFVFPNSFKSQLIEDLKNVKNLSDGESISSECFKDKDGLYNKYDIYKEENEKSILVFVKFLDDDCGIEKVVVLDSTYTNPKKIEEFWETLERRERS